MVCLQVKQMHKVIAFSINNELYHQNILSKYGKLEKTTANQLILEKEISLKAKEFMAQNSGRTGGHFSKIALNEAKHFFSLFNSMI